MSSPDMFFHDSEVDSKCSSFELSPSSPLAANSAVSSTHCLSSPVIGHSNHCNITDFSTPSDIQISSFSPEKEVQMFNIQQPNVIDDTTIVHRIKIEFFNSSGDIIAQSRYCDDLDLIAIISDLVRANEEKYRKLAVSKLANSSRFNDPLFNHLIMNRSSDFTRSIASGDSPLQSVDSEEKVEDVDLENVWNLCLDFHGSFLSALSMLCFGFTLDEITNKKHLKQRLLSVLVISAFSRNQRVNKVQKILGSYMKMNNTSKQGLQLLQRLGLTLVPKSIRQDQDKIASTFLEEVHERKKEIELWHERRRILEALAKLNGSKVTKHPTGQSQLSVQFLDDQYVEEINDLVQHLSLSTNPLVEPDEYVVNLVDACGGELNALETHLDLKPKMYDVTYDNLDISRTSCEYLVGQGDLSLHWTSSIIVQDVVDALELNDSKVCRDEFIFEDRIHVTKCEREHLLNYYVHLMMSLVNQIWPNAFPGLSVKKVDHQYTAEFEKEVRVWTGPLVCENESTLEGMSSIISKLTAELCPKTTNSYGSQIPISVTTFSGDQKTEKAGRSAQLAMLDNGSMMDKLAFIEGRHEMLHFLFMFIDLILDIFGDFDNLEEGCCLSRLIQFLNPKLERKRGKDCFYAFRNAFTDIFVAQLFEYLCTYLGVDNLDSDVTPAIISMEQDENKKQDLFKSMFREFIKATHHEFSMCDVEGEAFLPLFYPQQKYLRHSKRSIVESPSVTVFKASVTQSLEARNTESDSKLEYFTGLFNILGVLQLLLDSISEGNGLNCFLIQKMLLKLVHGSGHKNYACSMLASKNIILGHLNPQFSHKYMWNISCGRAGKGRKFPRDMKNEHHNRFLKDAFRSLGSNLNEKTAARINDSADAGVHIEEEVQEFFDIDYAGKTHSNKDRTGQIKNLAQMMRREKATTFVPNRSFHGPMVSSDISSMFDEAKYRSWHQSKEKELNTFEKLRQQVFSN